MTHSRPGFAEMDAYLRGPLAPETCGVLACELGEQAAWMVRCATALGSLHLDFSDATELMAYHLARDAAHYGHLALVEQMPAGESDARD